MKKQSFTLVEMLTVLAIIMALAGLLYPAINSSRVTARASACLSNQRQVIMAIQQSITANNNHFYSPTYDTGTDSDEDKSGVSAVRWTARLRNRRYLQDYSVMRCSEVLPPPIPKDEEAAKGDGYTFGAVHADLGSAKLNDPKGFDFRGTKLLRYKDSSDKFHDISPARLMLGGCSWNPVTKAGGALLDISTNKDPCESDPSKYKFYGRLYLAHRAAVNMFFYDGHAAAVQGKAVKSGSDRLGALAGDAALPYYLKSNMTASTMYATPFDAPKDILTMGTK